MHRILVRKDSNAPIQTVEVPLGSMYDALVTGLNGGYMEHINLQVDGVWLDIWLDEEGKLKGLPVNLAVPGDALVGPIVITGPADDEGRTIGLSPEEEAAARNLFAGTAREVKWPQVSYEGWDTVIEVK